MILADDNQTLLIDTKFGPASRAVKRWIGSNAIRPVTDVVNTHHHYDHTWGNVLYPDANIHAFPQVVGFMKTTDPEFWSENNKALPTELFDGDEATLCIGNQKLTFHLCAPAHTHADTWVHFVRNGTEYLFANDLLFNGVFPFFDDDHSAGANLPGIILAIRRLAERYPEAVVISGHGPTGTAEDLQRYSNFLENLQTEIEAAIEAHCTEDETVSRVDLRSSGFENIPSRHHTLFPVWSNAKSCVRMAFRVIFDTRAQNAGNRSE